MLLLNAEDGEVAHRAQLLPGSALVAISWTEAAGGGTGAASQRNSSGSDPAAAAVASSQLGADRTRRMFAPPPPPVPPATAGLAMGYAACGRQGAGGHAGWAPEPPRLAVLACASPDGDLVLCTSGLFPLASASLPRLLGASQVSVQRLATAPSLQQLTVAWREGPSGPLHLSTISLEGVGRHTLQLHRLALAAAHVGALLEGCRQSLAAACKEWGGGMREFEESRGRLVRSLCSGGGMAVNGV